MRRSYEEDLYDRIMRIIDGETTEATKAVQKIAELAIEPVWPVRPGVLLNSDEIVLNGLN